MHRKPYRRAGNKKPSIASKNGMERIATFQALPVRVFDTAPWGSYSATACPVPE
ncbi:MAG: hypothetical protein NZM15_01120 [Flavobacteriales bacterium]|nr:hypothetical protein [Flavobacteriales bacterium]MDW8431284.1 hypothetical protein [Flavobacteriales bacterium]